MKKIWLFLSLLICSILVAGCTNQQPQQKNFDFVSDCKNLVQNEFWDTEYEFSGDINYHSGVYFDYSIVTGSVYFNYKTRPFLCLYRWDESVVDIVDYAKNHDENIDLSYLQSLYDDLSQENWDEQRTNAESVFDLVALYKQFKEKYWNKDEVEMRNIIRNIAFQNWVTEDDLVDSDNYYNQVLDIWRQKYNQIPFYQREYYVELASKLLSEKWIKVYCSASICDSMTFSGNYGSQENLQNLVDDVTSVVTALQDKWLVFHWDFETHLPTNFYYDEYIRKIDPEIVKNPEGTPSIENLDDVIAICHNNSINCDMGCEDWDVTNKSYILPYKDGYIWYDYGWNWEWRGYYLTYKSVNSPCETISNTDEIFFWHTHYKYNKETFGYDEYPDDKVYISEWWVSGIPIDIVAKNLDCTAWKDIMEDDSCKKEVDKFMYNLIVWNEQNDYFTKWMNKFKKDIDDGNFTNREPRNNAWTECNEEHPFETLLQENWKDNRTLSDQEREEFIKINTNRIHNCIVKKVFE